MFTNYNNYDEETKAYVLELLEMCLNYGLTFEYMQHVKGVVVWYQDEVIGRCYLDDPKAARNLIMIIGIVKLYVKRIKYDLVS